MAENTNDVTTYASAYVTEKCEELERKLHQIDKKYSLDYQDPELDLPDSLGLEKMTFTPPSTEELTEKARQMLIADYTDKKFDIQSEASSQTQKVEQEKEEVNADAEADLAQLNEKYQQDMKKAYLDALEQGLVTSSVRTAVEQNLALTLQKAISEVEDKRNQKLEQLTQEIKAIAQSTVEQLANLDKVFEQQLQDKVNELLDIAYKEKETVLKYNNSVNEKEADYTVTKEKTEFNAFMDESDRAMTAAKLMATLGLTGVTLQKEKEKTELCKEFLGAMNKSDALAVIDLCTSLPGHLGEYYDYLVDYITRL